MLHDLASRGIKSAYHDSSGEAHGAEKAHTHYHGLSKGYFHIDYIFLSEDLMRRKTHFEIGPIKHSDHAPLIIDLDSASLHP